MTRFNKEILKAEIIGGSTTQDWAKAKLEWSLDYIYDSHGAETCLCGHYPIRELCVRLKNDKNGNKAVVGNVCVKKFMGNGEPEKIFRCFKRIQNDVKKALNEAAIEYANRKGWIRVWELDFLKGTRTKQYLSLTAKQQFKRKQVNQTVVRNIQVACRPENAA